MSEKTLTFRVEGMSCRHCQMAVENALKAINGVEKATVDLASKTATVTFDSGKIGPEHLSRAITAAGYEVVQ